MLWCSNCFSLFEACNPKAGCHDRRRDVPLQPQSITSYPLIVLTLRMLNSPGLMTKIFPFVVLASLTITGCRSADTGLAAFVPADTIALAGMRMDQVRATQLYQ